MKKVFVIAAALLLIAVKAGAQSSSASYPAGCWWAADDKDQFLLTMHIWRSTDEQNSCGDLTITDKDTDKELYSGTITYQYRELVNDVPTGVYYFNVVSDKGKQSRIAIRPWKQGREEIVVKSEGELKDHPLLKQKFYGIFTEVDEQPTMFLNTESELLAYLRESIANREEVGGAWGINPMLYVNAHARLNHELPIYAKPKGAGAVNIRDKASTTAAKVAELKPGETLLVIDEYDGWCQVKLGEDKTGWVSLSVVTLTNTKGRVSSSYHETYPPVVDGHLAFMGIPLSVSPEEMKAKLMAKSMTKDGGMEEETGQIYLIGSVDGVKSRIWIASKDEGIYTIHVEDFKTYLLPKAQTRFKTVLNNAIAIYGQGTYTDNYDGYKGYKIKCGKGVVAVWLMNEDEMDGASDCFKVIVVYTEKEN